MKITGKVKAVSDKGGKYGINMDDVWYNGFGDAPCTRGAEIEIDYEDHEVNGKTYHNVDIVIVITAGEKTADRADKFVETRANVDAGNCVQRATELIIAKMQKDKESIDVSTLLGKTTGIVIAAFKAAKKELE